MNESTRNHLKKSMPWLAYLQADNAGCTVPAPDAVRNAHRLKSIRFTLKNTQAGSTLEAKLRASPLSNRTKRYLLHRLLTKATLRSPEVLSYLTAIESFFPLEADFAEGSKRTFLHKESLVDSFLTISISNFHGDEGSQHALRESVRQITDEMKQNTPRHVDVQSEPESTGIIQEAAGAPVRKSYETNREMRPNIDEIREAVKAVMSDRAYRTLQRQHLIEVMIEKEKVEQTKTEDDVRRAREAQHARKQEDLSRAEMPEVNLLDDADWAG